VGLRLASSICLRGSPFWVGFRCKGFGVGVWRLVVRIVEILVLAASREGRFFSEDDACDGRFEWGFGGCNWAIRRPINL